MFQKRWFRMEGSDPLHLSVLLLLWAWARHLKTRTQKGQAICTSVLSASTKDCTSGNETRTQNACYSVPIRILSYSYNVIVPCRVLYHIVFCRKIVTTHFNKLCTLGKLHNGIHQVLNCNAMQENNTMSLLLEHANSKYLRVEITHCIHKTSFKIFLSQSV